MTDTDKTLEQLKAASDAANAKFRKHRDVQCEGHDDGSNPHEAEMNAAASAYGEALFWSRWTREYFEDRRAAWNAGMRAIPGFATGRVKSSDVAALANRLGVNEADMLRAKRHYA